MAQRGSGKRRVQPDLVPSLPPEDHFSDLLKGVLSDIQPGDIDYVPSTDQIIYYDRPRGTFTVPETPLTKSQFAHLFGNSQNRPTSVQLSIQQATKCQLRGDFRVRTIALTATTEESAIAGWTRVMDELCRMPSLRPKQYVVVDRKTHEKVQRTAVKKTIKEDIKEVEVICNLKEEVSSHMLKKGILGKIKAAVEGNVTLSLDLKAKSLSISADSKAVVTKAMAETLNFISIISEQVQTLYWSVLIPQEFAQSLVAILGLNSDFESIYGYIPVADIVFSPEITPAILGILPKLLAITGGVPVNINLSKEEIEGKGGEVPELTAELAKDASSAQLSQLNSLIYQELTHIHASFAPLPTPLSLHIAVLGETHLPSLPLLLPTGLDTSHLCLGKVADFPSIELLLV